MGTGLVVAGATAAGASAAGVSVAAVALALELVAVTASLIDLTPYQTVILYGYGGGLFMVALGYSGYRWPTRTMRLAAMSDFGRPVERPGDLRTLAFRAFGVCCAALGLFLLVWTTGEWV